MNYYKVIIKHKDYPEEGFIELRCLGKDELQVNDSLCATLQNNGECAENYLISIERVIDEANLNKIN